MKWISIAASILVGCAIGCTYLPETKVTYIEVWLENVSQENVSSVAMGADPHCSEFGVLGGKGARKVAVVPVQFARSFPVKWGQQCEVADRTAVVDLTPFEGVKNRAITLRYKGNGQWEAALGREIRPTKGGEVPR